MRLSSLSLVTSLCLIASTASAGSVTFVATGPTTIHPGGTTTFDVVVDFDPQLIAAVFQIDASSPLGIVSGQNDLSGTGLGQAGYDLRQLNFIPYPGTACSGIQPTCTAPAPGAPSAGNAGGVAVNPIAGGTFTIGSYTVLGNSVGVGSIAMRIRPGFEWMDSYYNTIDPTSNTLSITVNPIPEPTTAALLGVALLGLAIQGRMRASHR